MSEFVKITSSAAEIIASAQRIRGKGEEFTSQITPLLADVDTRDTDPKLGNDELGDTFRRETYHKDEGGLPMNEVAKQSVRALGPAATGYAGAVTQTMQDYQISDGEGALAIGSVTDK